MQEYFQVLSVLSIYGLGFLTLMFISMLSVEVLLKDKYKIGSLKVFNSCDYYKNITSRKE